MKTFPISTYWYCPLNHLPIDSNAKLLFYFASNLHRGTYVDELGRFRDPLCVYEGVPLLVKPELVKAWCFERDLTKHLNFDLHRDFFTVSNGTVEFIKDKK